MNQLPPNQPSDNQEYVPPPPPVAQPNPVSSVVPQGNNFDFTRILIVFVFVVVIAQLYIWGGLSSRYVLSQMFGVNTEATIVEFFIGLVAIVASISMFLAGIFTWMQNEKLKTFVTVGAVGFILKNILDIINYLVILSSRTVVSQNDIYRASRDIGMDVAQLLFWAFVMWWLLYKHKSYVTRDA